MALARWGAVFVLGELGANETEKFLGLNGPPVPRNHWGKQRALSLLGLFWRYVPAACSTMCTDQIPTLPLHITLRSHSGWNWAAHLYWRWKALPVAGPSQRLVVKVEVQIDALRRRQLPPGRAHSCRPKACGDRHPVHGNELAQVQAGQFGNVADRGLEGAERSQRRCFIEGPWPGQACPAGRPVAGSGPQRTLRRRVLPGAGRPRL